jgi:hypothetical protein
MLVNIVCALILFFRSKKSVGVTSERSTISSNDCMYQSAKRQRLENGHVNKVWYNFMQRCEICQIFMLCFSVV